MIRTLEGVVTHHMKDGLVVNVGGVGYLVSVPVRHLVAIGTPLSLFTFHVFREDSQALYGFPTMEELSTFELLLTVPSIGPKLAMTILGAATPADISQAVDTDNIAFFRSLPGLGGKSAAKIIVELKGKLTAGGEASIPSGGSELLEALTSLGYNPRDLADVLKSVPANLDLPAQLTWSLKALANRP